ncbi:MAG TPA: archaemetzincin family Zn-dependent metalloprotease [Blastocatellia bacterium]|nr:archaemetzincin family Zn-dependent metalloprotease [Blastocatellia bacterium]
MVTEVTIHPFERIADHLLKAVRAAIEERFGLQTAIGKELATPSQAYSRERGQYLSSPFLDLLAGRARGGNQILLGVTDVDLYAPELNFVFGEASSADRVAVISIARLYSITSPEKDREKTVERRAGAEAIHELGHVFNLSHCSRRDCVMWFSNTLAETDRKGTQFCPQHFQELRQAMRR